MIDRITTQPLYAVQAKRHVHPDGKRGGSSAHDYQDESDRQDNTQPETTLPEQHHEPSKREGVVAEEHIVFHTQHFDESSSYASVLQNKRLHGRHTLYGADHSEPHAEGTVQAAHVAAYLQTHQRSKTDERI